MIDPEENKPMNVASAMDYLGYKEHKVENFLRERFRSADHKFVLREMLKNPVSLANIVKFNYEQTEAERQQDVLKKITKHGALTIMIGAKGHGKSSSAVWSIEQIHRRFRDVNLIWYGFHEELEKQYPYVSQTCSFVSMKQNSFIIADEGSLILGARDAMTKVSKQRLKQLPTMRHRDAAVMIISQFSTSLDVNLFLLCDYIWFKPYFVTNFDERLKLPRWLRFCLPHDPRDNLVYDMNKEVIYTFRNSLPIKWNNEMSKPYSVLKTKKDARAFMEKLENRGFSDQDIAMFLQVRGWEMDDVF